MARKTKKKRKVGEKVKRGRHSANKNPPKSAKTFSKYKQKLNTSRRRSNAGSATCTADLQLNVLPKFVSNFHTVIQDVCNKVCVSCGCLYFSHSVSVRSFEWIEERLLDYESKISPSEYVDYIATLLDREIFYLCSYCQRSIVNKKIPQLSIYNGLGFPDVPPLIANLTDIQEKLLSPRIEFARVQVQRGGQKSLLGNIVNVPHNIDTSVKVIPRSFHELCVVNVQLMRRTEYQYPYLEGRISPSAVLDAAQYLLNTPVYKDLNITLSEDWLRHRNDEYLEVPSVKAQEFERKHTERPCVRDEKLAIAVGSDEESDSDDSDSGWDDSAKHMESSVQFTGGKTEACCSSRVKKCGMDRDVEPGQIDGNFKKMNEPGQIDGNFENMDETCASVIDGIDDDPVHDGDMSHENARFCAENETLVVDLNGPILNVRFAPCENETPIPLTCDKDPDILSHPSVYGGYFREHKFPKKPTVRQIKKFECKFYKRVRRLVSHLFLSFKMCYNSDIYNCVRVLLRKRPGDKGITVAQAMNNDFLKSVFKDDRGYTAFKTVRCTPAYWQAQGKKAVAMGRQFGKATFFITLSAAENHWADLIVALMEILKNVKLRYEDVRQWLESPKDEKPDIGLSSALIHELITADPITCVRQFYRRFQNFQRYVLKPEDGVFSESKMEDFFWRVEFQQRGSPHVHGVTWNENAPVFDVDDMDSFETCAEYIDHYISTARSTDDKLKHVIPYQIHRHSFTCKKNARMSCRFGFPRPPMPRTMILLPLEDSNCTTSVADNYDRIQALCNEFGRDFHEELSFNDFLDKLAISYDDYILAVRSSIVRATAFVRREVNAAFVNNYNEGILLAWEANMDIQYVIDGFATMHYIVGYMLKCESRTSKVLSKIMKSYQSGLIGDQEKVKLIANAFTNQGCITPQEAAQYVLGLPCVFTSRQEIFVNNNKPEGRIRMLKRKSQLEKLSLDSEDVLASNVVVRYSARPEELEDICLAEFAGYYELDSRHQKSEDEGMDDFDQTSEWTIRDDGAIENTEPHQKGKRHVLRNKLGHVYRRKVCKVIRFRRYNKVSQTSDYFRSQIFLFHPWRNENSDVWEYNTEDLTDEMETNIAKNQKLVFKDDYRENLGAVLRCSEGNESDDIFQDIYGVNTADEFETDDFGVMPRNLEKTTREFELFDEKKYRNMMQTLNPKQRLFVLELLTRLKNNESCKEPFHVFLNGGAGVGKSHVIHCILQSFKRFQLKHPSENPDREWVIVAAYTGKAAFNVGGVTLHSAFRFPKNNPRSAEVEPLHDCTTNELMNRYSELKLIIIDEVSMCSNYMLNVVNERLKQIMNSTLEFGGVPVLVVGDLRQLPPVGAPAPFQSFVKLPEESEYILKYLPRDAIINPLWKKFQYYKLTEVMRQKGDVNFMNALNHMAVGRMNEDDIKLIRSREVDSATIPFDTVRLFYSNKACDKHNASVYKLLKTEGVDSIAIDEVNGRVSAASRRSSLEFAKNMNKHQSDGLPYMVHLKVGATYFVTTNIDVGDGLFNGSTGVLKHIQYGPVVNCVKPAVRVWLDFNNPYIGRRARRNYNTRLPEGISKEWVPIEKIRRNLSREKLHRKSEIVRNQFPLRGANGMTIHKSQGSTLDSVAVSCRTKLSRQLLYVACSRATCLSGLYIQNGKFRAPERPSKHDKVEVELGHLRNCPFIPDIRKFSKNKDKLNFFFANITSLIPVVEDLEADSYLIESSIIFLVEPRLLVSDVISLNGFEIDTRIDCRNTRNSEGIVCFRKTNFNSDELQFQNVHQDYEQDGHFIVALWKVRSIHVYVFYRSPKYNLSKSIHHILNIATKESEKAVIVGDINWNFNSGQNDSKQTEFVRALKNLGFDSLLQFSKPSTDYGTVIDIAFSNIAEADAWFYDLYFNYHKGICFTIPILVQEEHELDDFL